MNLTSLRDSKNVSFYNVNPVSKVLVPQTSRSNIERRLKLSERAEKSLIEERSKNLKSFFKGNKSIGGIFQTILRKDTIADDIQSLPNGDLYEAVPTINISKCDSEGGSVSDIYSNVNMHKINSIFGKTTHSKRSSISTIARLKKDQK